MAWGPLFCGMAGLLLAGTAQAGPIRGTQVDLAPGSGDVLNSTDAVGSNVLYLNQCTGGCTVYAGYNNSRTNTSSIPNGTSFLPQFEHGQDSWNDVVTCVRRMMEPFDIQVTDVDPGNASHFEAMVAGMPADLGREPDVGGVAPASCGVIENSISFTFANLYNNNPRRICETIAQEAAHTWGLDHEFDCRDPMTYLGDCGPKHYVDEYLECGEYEARWCNCGGSTQNSHQQILSIFGAGQPTPPTVTFSYPVQGETVRAGFHVKVEAVDNIEVDRVSLTVNGSNSGELGAAPYIFNTPASLADGQVTLVARAWDNRGSMQQTQITVTVDNSCTGPADCPDDYMCDGSSGQCVPKPQPMGELGDDCDGSDDCISGICGTAGDNSYCTEPCDVSNDSCPEGFQCLSAGDAGVCWPGGGGGGGGSGDDDDDDAGTGGGCSVGSSNGPISSLGLLALGLLLVGQSGRRRRRR